MMMSGIDASLDMSGEDFGEGAVCIDAVDEEVDEESEDGMVSLLFGQVEYP